MKNKRGYGVLIIFAGIFLLIVAIVIIGPKLTGNPIKEEKKLIKSISNLKPLNINSIETYEEYKTFTDKANNLIQIINEQTEYEYTIPSLKLFDEASFGKVAEVISDYGPLISNYNSVIFSAQELNSKYSEENYKTFQKNLGIFSLEFAILSSSLIKWASFEVVSLAFVTIGVKCPQCIKIVSTNLNKILTSKAFEQAETFMNNLINPKNIT